MARILVVDDEPDNRLLFQRILDRDGHHVLQAGDGHIGFAMALQHYPDLILMDLSMPIPNGWETTRRLKQHSLVRHIPVVALTAHAMLGDHEQALAAGCDDYLTKPIDLIRFRLVVNQWVAQTQAYHKHA